MKIRIVPILINSVRIALRVITILIILFAALSVMNDAPNVSSLTSKETIMLIGFVLIIAGLIMAWFLELYGSSMIITGYLIMSFVEYDFQFRFLDEWFLVFPGIAAVYLIMYFVEKKPGI